MNTQKRSRQKGGVGSHLCFYCLVPAILLAAVAALFNTVRQHSMATTGPALAVDVGADRHPIAPDIYGMNTYSSDPALAKELHIPVNRWGGNATSRYNWLVDSSNAGDDWFFIGGSGNARSVAGAAVDRFVSTNRANGSKSIVTIPMLGYVNATSTWNCGFSVAKYGPQQAINPYIHPQGDSCGNGKHADGTLIANNDPLDVSKQVSPAFMRGWVEHLMSIHGTAVRGGVQIYQLDNEPSGWSNTHRDVHPKATSYDELRDRTYQYASMIKAADPNTQTLGPSDFGWPVFMNSGVNGDREAHRGIWFAEWYLQQMRAYEQLHGVRILDYFDEHYYPPTANVPAGNAKMQALRLRSTRSLWDPTYTDESPMGQNAPPFQLIRRFRAWVNQDYPGTKVAMTEYNWGGLESINGALAQADVLGIFGQEQLELATLWGPPQSHQPGAYAFRMYLNYDRKGSHYGETWVRSTSVDRGTLAIYGAERSRDGALTLMIINKTGNDLTSSLVLKGFSPAASAAVYTYSGVNPNAIMRQPDRAVSASGFSAMYPANSITLAVIPRSSVRS